ncbi:conserved hypothetical protein [Pseudoalteromonas sp. 3J6]|nr:conserved hypothetical protein [Pseudoalteromonas sp. 3J6]
MPLLMLRLTANYAYYTSTFNNFTVTAYFLNGSTYFHCSTP